MKILASIGFLLLLSSGYAQDMTIYASEETKSWVDTYNTKAENFSIEDSAYFYFNRAMVIAQKIDYHKGEVRACKGLIKLYENDDEIYERLRYALKLVRLYEKKGSNSEKAYAYDLLGKLYFNEKLFAKATETFSSAFGLTDLPGDARYGAGIWLTRSQRLDGKIDEALLTARTIEFEKNLNVYQRVELQKEKAEIYHELRAYSEELGSYNLILDAVEGTSYAYLKPVTWNNIGFVNKYLKRTKLATCAFYNSINTAGKGDFGLVGTAYYNLGLIYHNANDIDSSLICFTLAEEYYHKGNDWAKVADAVNMQAMSFYHNNDIFNAQKRIDAAFRIEKDKKLQQQEARSHEIQSYIHQELFEFELALASYKKFLSIRDSLITEERSQEYRLLFDQYKVEQIEKQLRLIWAKNEIELINLAKEKAELDAQRERDRVKIKEDELRIAGLEYAQLQAREQLQKLQLEEERLNLENKQKELDLIQRENELKELALEKERLLVSEKEKENKLLAKETELERQRRLNEELDFNNKLRLIFGALLFIIIILIGILIAYRQLRKRKKQIEKQNVIIAESKKEIEIQKEKSDNLLLNILPIKVAEELKVYGSSKPRMYNEVSVGFTDFSGFTMISEKLTPEELVEKLDEMFLEFDKIIERHGLQRIKTIGDAYMFAAGLPDPIEDHAIRSVKAALEMRDFIDSFNAKLDDSTPKWNIRIGVNTGPVVAGVIGIKKFAYDIWGDTVNTAARMESSGKVGKVNISGSTYERIKQHFHTVHRGKVHAKNKGEIDMYFVENL